MANVFDYLDWRGDVTFSQVGYNEIDSLILSLISYVQFDDIVPSAESGERITLLDAARGYVRKHRGKPLYVGLIVPPEVVSLMAKAAKSKRFGGLWMQSYENRIEDEAQMQFCAMTFTDEVGTNYVAFRGTDDTLIGWKENLNMSFRHPVPAQLRAVAYVEEHMARLSGPFVLCGHSKGGNLAVYAAVSCDARIKDRILAVYSNEGPGFTKEFITDTPYLDMRGRIRTFVPQSSVVGMLLEHEESYEVVKSSQSGLLQHNAFSWEVLGAKFVHLDALTEESRRIDRTVKKWVNDMQPEEREAFVESLYETIRATNAKTLTELNADKIRLVRAWNQLSPESRALVRKCIILLITDGAKAIKPPKSEG